MKAPVQVANYRMKKLNFEIIKDFKEFDLEQASFSVDVDFDLYSNDNDPLRYKIDLFLKVLPATENEMYLPYEIELIMEGLFFFEEELEEELRNYHLNISCPTMLYGAARNIVHQLSAENGYGPISIPSVQFSKISEQKSENDQNSD